MKQIRAEVTAAVWLLVLGASLCGPARADVPRQMTYQGFLRDSAGQPVSAPVNFHFYLYPDSVSGPSCWDEAHVGVAVVDGLFDLTLGSSMPLDPECLDGSVRWLETWVNGAPLSPRKPIHSVPYALSAARAGAGIDSIVAGPGLVGTGADHQVALSVGAGLGVAVGPDEVSLDLAFTDARYVDQTEFDALDAPIGAIIDYGTSLNSGVSRTLRQFKICYGRARIGSGNYITISGLPFASASSYKVTVTRELGGYATQSVTTSILSGSAFEIRDFTYDSEVNWIAVGI